MLRINLLKRNSGGPPPRWTKGARVFAAVVAVFSGLCLIASGVMLAYQWYGEHFPGPVAALSQDGARPDAPLPSQASAQAQAPSASEADLAARASSYDNMPFDEKTRFEPAFAKNVFAMLSRAVAPGIELSVIEFNPFQNIRLEGTSAERQLAGELFKSLERENASISPPPGSCITPDGNGGYRFTILCNAAFGSLPSGPPADSLPGGISSGGRVASILDRFASLALQNHVAVLKGPRLEAREKIGPWLRSSYSWSGSSGYEDFTRFVGSLYDAGLPCALGHCALTMHSADTTEIESQVVIMSKE